MRATSLDLSFACWPVVWWFGVSAPLGVRAAVAARTVEREADGACRPVLRDVEPASATRVRARAAGTNPV